MDTTDILLAPSPDTRPHAAPAERAQAVRCGSRWIAFSSGWARKATDELVLSAVPGAPPWLAGVANVDGRVVPVLDLVAWLDPQQGIDPQAKDARLLVGGDGEDSMAVLFQGLPRLAQVARTGGAGLAVDRLSPFVVGHDTGETGTVLVDAPALTHALIEELALR